MSYERVPTWAFEPFYMHPDEYMKYTSNMLSKKKDSKRISARSDSTSLYPHGISALNVISELYTRRIVDSYEKSNNTDDILQELTELYRDSDSFKKPSGSGNSITIPARTLWEMDPSLTQREVHHLSLLISDTIHLRLIQLTDTAHINPRQRKAHITSGHLPQHILIRETCSLSGIRVFNFHDDVLIIKELYSCTPFVNKAMKHSSSLGAISYEGGRIPTVYRRMLDSLSSTLACCPHPGTILYLASCKQMNIPNNRDVLILTSGYPEISMARSKTSIVRRRHSRASKPIMLYFSGLSDDAKKTISSKRPLIVLLYTPLEHKK